MQPCGLMGVVATTAGDVLSRTMQGGGERGGGRVGLGHVVRWLGGSLTAPLTPN